MRKSLTFLTILLIVLTAIMFRSSFNHPWDAPYAHTIQASGNGFYNTFYGEPFVPRGNDYIVLKYDPNCHCEWHATFDVGLYDHSKAENALAQMSLEGYNIVRVVLNNHLGTGGMADPQGGLSSFYLDNLVDFLQLADSYSLKVILVQDAIPGAWAPYGDLERAECCSQFDGFNMDFLSSGGLGAYKLLWHDFVSALTSRNAPLSGIFSYELFNEAHFQSGVPPVSLTSGMITTANGNTYDMSDQNQRESMMSDGWVYWVDQLRSEIRRLDATAMVSISFYAGGGDWVSQPARAVIADPASGGSSLDYVDIHFYPGHGGLTLDGYMSFFGIQKTTHPGKPLMMGEFGAFRSVYPNLADAASALKATQVASCDYLFAGWLLWTWSTPPYGGDPLWNALDKIMPSDGGGAIDGVLAPTYRPNPCA